MRRAARRWYRSPCSPEFNKDSHVFFSEGLVYCEVPCFNSHLFTPHDK
jgi:hypothetical protein